jgi:uncharacterized protein involved in tellurium resistance
VIGDPATASPRTDLTFLRRRVRPRTTPAARSTTVAPPAHGIDYTRHDRPAAVAQPAAGARPTIDFSRPGRHPSAPAAAAPAPTPVPVPAGSGSLDLSAPAAPSTRPNVVAQPTRPPVPRLRVHRDARVAAHEQRLLSIQAPTVTLTRVQSGVGHVAIEAVCSPEIGDLRLGAVYQLRSGGTSVVQHAGGSRFAPSSRRPVIVGGRDEYERISLDLRQIRDIERIGIYAFSEARSELHWGGTLVVTTFGGARVELPMETLYPGRIAMLISLYNLDGELVIRAEMETIVGDVREAARAYGYDRITWRDDRTPVD